MAATMKDLIVEVTTLVKGSMSLHSYRKRSGDIYTCDLHEDTLGWVGFNRAARRQDNRLEINPMVGVRNQRVERLVSDALKRDYNSYHPPTICVHLGYLMPENKYQPWFFEHGAHNKDIVERMVGAVEIYGKSFMQEHVTLEALHEAMASGQYGYTHQNEYRIPVVLDILGRSAEAKAFLESRLAEISEATDPGSEQYKSFASRLLEQRSVTVG